MSFEPIKWVYTPPPTLAPGVLPAAEVQTGFASGTSAGAAAAGSNAGQLVARLALLNQTAQYLESAILAISNNRGVVLDLSTNPELSSALQRIYNDTPAGISVGMYNSLLDSEIGMTRAQIVLGKTGASLQVDPVQQHDIATATKAFDQAMLNSGSFANQVPLLLRSLKNDRVVFDNMTSSLQTYPVLNQDPTAPTTASKTSGTDTSWAPPDASSSTLPSSSAPIDVNQDTTDNLNERADAWEQNYGGIYQTISTPSSLLTNVSQYSSSLGNQILSDLQTIQQILQGLQALFMVPTLQSLADDICMFIWSRLASEASSFLSVLDQAVQSAVSPVQSILNSFSSIFNQVQYQASEIAFLAVQGNQVRNAIAGNSQPLPPDVQATLATIPKELGQIGGYISWALSAATQQHVQVETGAMKLLDLKLNFGQKHNQVLDALKDAEAIVSVLKAFVQVMSQQQSSILGTLTQSEAATGVVENGVIQYIQQSGATSTPNLPTPPTSVQSVLGLGVTP